MDVLIVADIKCRVVGTGLDPHEDVSCLQGGQRLPVGGQGGNLSVGGLADVDAGDGKENVTQQAGTVGISRHVPSGLTVQIPDPVSRRGNGSSADGVAGLGGGRRIGGGASGGCCRLLCGSEGAADIAGPLFVLHLHPAVALAGTF